MKRLSELYHQHLTGLPVTVVLDDATDAEQVRTLVPERSDSLVLVTARGPLELPARLPAWVHQLPVEPLDAAGAEELLREAGAGHARVRTTPKSADRRKGVVRRSAARAAHRGVLARAAYGRGQLADGSRRVRPGRAGGAGAVAALHRPGRAGPPAAAPAGARRAGLPGRGRGGGAAGRRRGGGRAGC